MGWREFENGRLLDVAERDGFDLFMICDKNMRHQQNLTPRHLAIAELWTNHRPTLEQHFSLIAQQIESMGPGYRVIVAPPA